MTNSQRLAIVRDRLSRWLSQTVSGDADDAPTDHSILSESILIRDEFYVGRRFDLGDYRAVWFLEEDELKIYAKNGGLLVVLSSEDISQPDFASDQPDVLRMPETPSQAPQQDDQAIRRAA